MAYKLISGESGGTTIKEDTEMNGNKLPGGYESKYKSESLKEKIADEGMWLLIPAVKDNMNSKGGIRRLEMNHQLFSFIDENLPDDPFAFEPNMSDGRFVFLPDDVSHQGMGICVSEDFPGFLEVGHFWYPCEFTEKTISIGPAQVYVPMFSMKPGTELVEMVRRVYMTEKPIKHCTFPFEPDLVVTLEGDFLDRMNESIKLIRDALKGRSAQVKKNGEGLIHFMKHVME